MVFVEIPFYTRIAEKIFKVRHSNGKIQEVIYQRPRSLTELRLQSG